MIQAMNKSIKHILRNYFTNIVFKTALVTTDIFDHLPIRYLSQNTILQKSKDIYTFIYRKIYIYIELVFSTQKR